LPARRCVSVGDRHLHAHFATAAALEAMRLSRLLNRPYSVAPHAFEIFARPANLVEKLSGAKFVSTDCAYNVDHLRDVLDAEAGARVNEVILGIDMERFTRSTDLPGTRVVGAVGRLVEKKGFADLVAAIGLLEQRGRPIDELRIVGAGPLLGELERLSSERGVADRVRFVGSLEPEEVLETMQGFDLLAMPCVIAADGDRDSMPVVVKEAMALELMAVGTDLVGLPEMIKPEWGRLVPPHDPASLAGAIDELLALSVDQRRIMGAAARQFVAERCNVDREAEKVARLIRSG
jgi:colanic acid/amylovoran biosynthesis glycosyltransferase